MSRFPLLLVALLLATGCAAPRQTAVVTDRPVAAADTTPPPPRAPLPAVLPVEPVTPPSTTMDARYDTVRAGRFDAGKMWTFDNPPLGYFQEAYGFAPDTSWFRKARLGALRFKTYCSASFVSPDGLVMTNHHCGRESITDVSKEGEELLDKGFYARSMADERKVEDLYVDQLVDIRDVTSRIYEAQRGIKGRAEQAAARGTAAEELQKTLDADAKRLNPDHEVQVIALYDGARYSAYTFRRYKDVRLVMAPELQLGFFGGDPDNFTYPRYALDVSFFRVYEGDKPFKSPNYFAWSTTGAQPGEPVFVVGNPGSTSRLATVSMLEYERDVELPAQLAAIEARMDVLRPYIARNPEAAEAHDLRNSYFSLSNSQKSITGQLEGLRDPYLMARKRAAEAMLVADIAADADLQASTGTILRDVAGVQKSKRALADQHKAFLYFASPPFDSPILTRATYGYFLSLLNRNQAPEETIADYRKQALEQPYWPADLEEAFIAMRLASLRDNLPQGNAVVRRVLGSSTPEEVAARIVAQTALNDSTRYKAMLEDGFMSSGDVTVDFADAMVSLYLTTARAMGGFGDTEEGLLAGLAQARFDLYGAAVPPDASFSLRIADGVVKGYTYNGTEAPPHTTFFGLYDRHYSNTGDDWALPETWLDPPDGFELDTPINFVSTNDITGGNSGSPVINQNLEVVGLAFDSNIEALPNEYVFRDVTGRTVSVDVRGILEALDDIYDADRLVLELTTRKAYDTEEAADAARQE